MNDASSQRFPIRIDRLNRTFALLGMRPKHCYIDLGAESLEVRMGAAFHLVVPRSSITESELDHGRVGGWGVHGWRGSWLVNGSSHGVVQMTVDPPGRARMLGFAVKVTNLRVSLQDPDAFLAAIHPS